MLNRNLLRDHSLKCKLPTIATRLIIPLSMVTDIDGRINMSIEEIRKQELMTSKCIPTALKALEDANCIRKQDGVYYNNMSLFTTDKPTKFEYVTMYNFFNKPEFKKLYKRAIHFIFYILTSQLPGEWHSFAIERSYRTASHTPILNYFYCFKDFLNVLIDLIEKGILEVEFNHNQSVTHLCHETQNIKSLLKAYCEQSQSNRKKRTCNPKNTHVIRVRISKKLVNKKEVTSIYDPERLSTLRDLQEISLNYGHELYNYTEEALQEIHITKLNLFKKFGSYGIQLYREALQTFFKEQSHLFPNLMRKVKFGQHINTYYVTPTIQMTIQQKLKDIQEQYLALLNTEESITLSTPYVAYLVDHAQDDELVKLNVTLKKHVLIQEQLYKEEAWRVYLTRLGNIYKEQQKRGLSHDEIIELSLHNSLWNESAVSQTNEKLSSNNQNNRQLTHTEQVGILNFDSMKVFKDVIGWKNQ